MWQDIGIFNIIRATSGQTGEGEFEKRLDLCEEIQKRVVPLKSRVFT